MSPEDEFMLRIPPDLLRGRPDISAYNHPDEGRKDLESYDRRLRERLLGEVSKLASDTHWSGGPGREERRYLKQQDAADAAPFTDEPSTPDTPEAPSGPRIEMPGPGEGIYEGWRTSSVGNTSTEWTSLSNRQFGGQRQDQDMVRPGGPVEPQEGRSGLQRAAKPLAALAFVGSLFPASPYRERTQISKVV